MTGALLVRTIVGESKADLEAKVAEARADGWQVIGNPGYLVVDGRPAKGRASWVQHMKRT